VRRGVQALSAWYVEKRARGARVFDGAGKRAAFALFYGPLHYAVTHEIVRRLGAVDPAPSRILDLGCGTGAAGAAWAVAAGRRPKLAGIDVQAWAVAEANWSWAALELDGRARQGRVESSRLTNRGGAVLLAYAANELDPAARDSLLPRLLAAAEAGTHLLVIEPIAAGVAPWWPDWAARFEARGGRADRWRLKLELPERLRLLDRAAGLDHRELTARSLYLA
jgi:SAM-dependent methyltransferase